jgi:hypothetical protein
MELEGEGIKIEAELVARVKRQCPVCGNPWP